MSDIEITREEALYIHSMINIIESRAEVERGRVYIDLIAREWCRGRGLVIPLKGKTVQEMVEMMLAFVTKYGNKRGERPKFRRKISREEEEQENERILETKWERHNVKEYEFMKNGKHVGAINVLKLDDKRVEEERRYEWLVYGTDKSGYERYLYKAQNHVETYSIGVK
jgi:hypothetical protein